MHLKINGKVTAEDLADYFNQLIEMNEEKTGKEIFCTSLDL